MQKQGFQIKTLITLNLFEPLKTDKSSSCLPKVSVLNGLEPSTRVIYALLLRQPNDPLYLIIVKRFCNR